MTVRNVCRAVSILPVVVAAFAAGASTARAQSLRPHVLLIFDTSGSMRDDAGGNTVGEGTNICTAGTGSRLYNLKSALRAALAETGTDEANFGLMSFALSAGTNFQIATCSNGHYASSTCRANIATPNRPNPSMMNCSCGGVSTGCYNAGCMMTTHGVETTFGPWFTSGASEVLKVGVTTAAPGVTPTAANYDPADANIPGIYRWLDNVELPTANGAVTDPELHGTGFTPLGRSLFYAKMYYDGVVKPNDPKASCRQNVVILVTDGQETCDDSTAPSTTMFNLTTCTGGPVFNPFHPVVQACQLFRQSNVKMYMITDNGLPAADLTTADRIAAAGGTTAAIRVSLANASLAKAALVGIIAQTVPPAETCNGLDDNCNGQIDEGVKNLCPLDLTATLKHCAVETANCLDDDCDGLIDEGFPLNACGKSAVCPIPTEVCDGLDNDCDGDVDEGFDVGGACNNGLTGTCRRVGIKECTPDKLGVTCNLGGAPTATEICNGIDDDCNGMVDDGLGTGQGIGVDCGIQGQGCNKGITKCIAGKIVCEGSSQPTMETCNGRDDDCNGLIDDGTFPGEGDSCLCPGLTQAQVGVGVCRAGRIACKGASGLQCDGCILPQPEICNGKDDDCDGMADHMATCPSGFGCRDGSCGLQCRGGEFPCPPGYDCVQTFCVPNRCKNVQCPITQKCDMETGSCVDLCYKVTCLSGQTCMGGSCHDCSDSPQLACAAGQVCVNRQCVTDKCAGVTCNGNQYCSNGNCFNLTCGAGCGAKQICIAGQCRPFNCDTASCTTFVEFCDYDTGTCMPNMCATKTCPFCAPATGECTPDPCANVGCPNDGCWSCQTTPQGQPYCVPSTSCGHVRTLAGNKGGGCACDVVDGRPSVAGLGMLALLGLTIFVGRRRRQWCKPATEIR